MSHAMRCSAWVLLLSIGVLTAACDAFAEYTVENRSELPLLTWPSFELCERIDDVHAERLDQEMIQPDSRFDYYRSYAPWVDSVKCVVVTTESGGLVLAQEYDYGRLYVIDPEAQPAERFPAGEKYDDSLWTAAGQGRVGAILTLTIAVLMIGVVAAALLLGLFVTVRSFDPRRRLPIAPSGSNIRVWGPSAHEHVPFAAVSLALRRGLRCRRSGSRGRGPPLRSAGRTA